MVPERADGRSPSRQQLCDRGQSVTADRADPGVKPLTAQIDSASVLCCDDSPRAVINRFLDWAQRFDNVWSASPHRNSC